MTEKTPKFPPDHLYERNDNFCISGLPVTSLRPCSRPPPLLPLALGPVTITPYKERLAWRACLSKHTNYDQRSYNFRHSSLEWAMATPSAENLDPSGPSAASDVIKALSCFTKGAPVAIISSGRKNFGQF